MQLKGSDIMLPKYSSSTSQIRQKKDYRDKEVYLKHIKMRFIFQQKYL